jgi:uncharacterized protein YoxC
VRIFQIGAKQNKELFFFSQQSLSISVEMPKKCLMCAREINPENEAEARKCNGCGQWAHDSCVRLLLAGKASSARGWKCNSCAGNNSPILEAPRTGDYSLVAQLRILEETISENINRHITATFDDFKNELIGMTNKITELSQKIDGLEKTKKEMFGRLDDQQQEILQLKGLVNDLQQSKLSLNLEIHGVPQKADEKLQEVIHDIAEVIGIPESTSEIKKIYRGRKIRDKPAPIVLEFSSDNAKDEWLEGRKSDAFREYKLPVLFSESVAADASNSAGAKKKGARNSTIRTHGVRIFEQLTYANRQLLYETKKAAKECSFKYAWTRGGKMFVRRDGDKKTIPIRIRSMEDILTKVRQNRVPNEPNQQEAPADMMQTE